MIRGILRRAADAPAIPVHGAEYELRPGIPLFGQWFHCCQFGGMRRRHEYRHEE